MHRTLDALMAHTQTNSVLVYEGRNTLYTA